MPTRDGMTDVAIDAEVPPDVIDDNILVSVLPAIIEGGDLPLVVHLSQSRPHRLLRLEPVDSPMLVVRKEPPS